MSGLKQMITLKKRINPARSRVVSLLMMVAQAKAKDKVERLNCR